MSERPVFDAFKARALADPETRAAYIEAQIREEVEREFRVTPLQWSLMQAVRTQRRDHPVTQLDLAKRSGLQQSQISKMLLGTSQGSVEGWSSLLLAAGLSPVVTVHPLVDGTA